MNAIGAIAFANARFTVGAATVYACLVAVHDGVVTRGAWIAIRASTVGNAEGIVLGFQTVQKTISTQFGTRWAFLASTVDANLSCIFVKHTIGVHIARRAASTTIDPLLAQKGFIYAVFARVTGFTNGPTTIHQLLSIVEDFVITVLPNEVVVVQAARKHNARQCNHK